MSGPVACSLRQSCCAKAQVAAAASPRTRAAGTAAAMAPNVKEAKSGEMTWHSPKENPKSTGKPAARSGHTLACANEKAYLFGGCGIEDGGAAVFNDIWILHIADNFRWEKVDAMGDVPSPRWRHSFTFPPDNTSIFLFGGLCRVRSS